MPITIPRLLCTILTCAACSATASAAGLDTLDDTLSFQAGYFLSSWNTELQLDANGHINEDIDIEEQLGFDEDDDTYLLGLKWRMGKRHQLTVGYWDFHRTATSTLNTEIDIQDETYPAGATVRSEWDIYIAPVSYSYSFYQSESLEAFASVGAHWTSLEFGARGDVFVGDRTSTSDGTARATADAPLPLLGAGVRYGVADHWEAGLQLSWFGLNLDLSGGDLEGDIYNADAYVEYRFSDLFSAGLKYTYFEIDVDADSKDWQGGVDFRYQGPQLYIGFHL